MYDEREENFREMAALGNVKAMKAYLHAGVNIDGQNKMNGQTALHWACVRGNSAAVELLVRAGADATITNNKGQTPLEVCKEDSIKALLPNHRKCNGTDNGSTTTSDMKDMSNSFETSFMPNYMANPDLSKAWGIPEDALLPAQGESGYTQQLQYEASMSKANTRYRQGDSGSMATLTPVPAAASVNKLQEQELLVYNNKYGEDNLLGSVFVDANKQTIAELKTQLVREIDGVSEDGEFTVARYNGKQTIPIGAKQESFFVERVFRSNDEAVIVMRKNQQ
ncbi:hypothetical protein IW140_004850 [Coemansia sp. RSA 1813]|nr:hypothetical protein EV178_004896 [Coemansia sp. RSA 1646]KAJ1769503.1 hypothetical protein LPJ74_003989 [Coemansia sp. RSA 1843]KAJ2087482.1 hypothetical protein IW138_004942 [Coemansia sp. RSA 986]KAJ2211699.1 hypothetical protein EV179_005256 [Coemansia sp. RSA 487]KAJ2566662.1 hypothetical protein IW140_004850 [Coemansia sp. RSA 1813]